MHRLALAAALGLVGCADREVELELRIEDGGCTATALQEVAVVSIEVLGDGGDSGMCALGRRCLYDVDMSSTNGIESIAELAEVLHDAKQPLVDADYQGALDLRIVGHRQEDGCWAGDMNPVCGQADFADATDGELAVTMRCQPCGDVAEELCL